MNRFVVFTSLIGIAAAGAQFAACSVTTVSSPGTDGGSSGSGSGSGGGSGGSSGSGSGGGSGSGSSGGSSSGSGSGSSGSGSGGITDSGTDSGKDSGTEAGAGVTLTVMNYLSWCSVTINGGTAFTGATGTASVATGSTATIVATPLPGFEIGADPWFGVDQNDGGAAPGTDVDSGMTAASSAQVTIGAGPTQCVSVCCQTAGANPTDCPATNPCP